MDKIIDLVERQMLEIQKERCEGCQNDLPEHDCDMPSNDMNIFFNFSEALDRIEKNKIITILKDACYEQMLIQEVGEELTYDLIHSGEKIVQRKR